MQAWPGREKTVSETKVAACSSSQGVSRQRPHRWNGGNRMTLRVMWEAPGAVLSSLESIGEKASLGEPRDGESSGKYKSCGCAAQHLGATAVVDNVAPGWVSW